MRKDEERERERMMGGEKMRSRMEVKGEENECLDDEILFPLNLFSNSSECSSYKRER